MIYGCKLSIILVLSITLSGCGQRNLAQPSCRVAANAVSNHYGAGACIVVMNNKLLVIQLDSDLYDLPISHAQSPNAHNNVLLSAQCLAHNAMWQQTGLNVEVRNLVGAQLDGTWLFTCISNAGFDGSEAPFNPPSWSKSNIKKIAFIDPFDIDLQNWSRRDHFTTVRDAYVAQSDNR